jgi:peptidoglycan/xylan/chitin deacetylase (PgdA/CDA1 family)
LSHSQTLVITDKTNREDQQESILGGTLFRFVGNLLSPAGDRGRLSILIYHRTLAAPDPILHDEIDAATFARHMALLAADFNVLPLGEACARLVRGGLPARAACITFDDGYADNERLALPILKRFGLQATFFVSTGFSDGGIMFNDGVIETVRYAPSGMHDLSRLGLGRYSLDDSASRRAAIDALLAEVKYRPLGERDALIEQLAAAMRSKLPKDLMMRPTQIKRLRDEGMEIGGHTVNHPILAVLDAQQARAEIVGGKHCLEEITGAPVTLFAYPNGKPGRDYGPRDVELVKEAGFTAAVSTLGGVANRGSDVFQLPRFGPWDRNPLRLGVRLLLNCARTTPARTSSSHRRSQEKSVRRSPS